MNQPNELKIFHNGSCSKSRAALELIEKSGRSARIIHYLETPPSAPELDSLLTMLGLEPVQIARAHEDRYEELGLKIRPPRSREEWLNILVANPILIERPIITDGKRAVIGRPPEKVLELLKD